jgi:hypothetical protein
MGKYYFKACFTYEENGCSLWRIGLVLVETGNLKIRRRCLGLPTVALQDVLILVQQLIAYLETELQAARIE